MSFLKRFRHKKRGTLYTAVGIVHLQSTGGPVEEGTPLMIYMGMDGKLWARPKDEFFDGRFEAVDE
jgi:hypothetical protein